MAAMMGMPLISSVFGVVVALPSFWPWLQKDQLPRWGWENAIGCALRLDGSSTAGY